MAIKKVCVIGSGTMGNGITQVVAQGGYETTMVDVKQEFIDKGMNAIKASLGRFVEKGRVSQWRGAISAAAHRPAPVR